MKRACRQRMSGDPRWYDGGDRWRNTAGKLFRFGEISNIDCVHDEEEQARNCSNPNQEPCDVDGNILSPGARVPFRERLYDTHLASSTPPIARFTRFLMRGILYALNCKGTAPRTASLPAI